MPTKACNGHRGGGGWWEGESQWELVCWPGNIKSSGALISLVIDNKAFLS